MTRDFLKKWIRENLLDIKGNISSSKLQLKLISKNNIIDSIKYNQLVEETNFLSEDCKIIVRIYCILNDITQKPICKTCGKPTEYQVALKKFAEYCSRSCISQCGEIKEKKKKLSLEKYGTTTPLIAKEIKEKTRQTTLKKYGVTHYSKTDKHKNTCRDTINKHHKKIFDGLKEFYDDEEKVKSAIETRKKTCIEKYGVDQIANVPEIREKCRKTCIEKYGADNPSKNPEVIKKIVSVLKEKYSVEFGNSGYAQQKHISQENLLRLNNPDWLHQEHTINQRPLYDIAQELGVSHSLVQQYFRDYGLPVHMFKQSFPEKQITEFIRSIYNGVIETNIRTIIGPKELDVYIPNKKLAIEYNGSYYHTNKERTYHLRKTIECQKLGIQLLHILDNEWTDLYKQPIWKSMIQNKLGIYKKIYGRKCSIQKVSPEEEKQFLNENHLQGYIGSKICLGLYENENLVSLMSFGKPRFNKNYQWEILRFSTLREHSVIGGASKVLKHFEKTILPKSIITYCDLRYSSGTLYKRLGFDLVNRSSPNYWYFKNNQVHHRIKFQKHKLSQLLEIFDPKLTEKQNMTINGYSRIYDCGNLVFTKNYPT